MILDCAPVTIGDGTQIAPGVQLLAADHPRDPQVRRDLREFVRPISIGSNVWIGAAAIVLPGVSVGDDSIIGANSVVTADIAAGVVAVGTRAASCGSSEAPLRRGLLTVHLGAILRQARPGTWTALLLVKGLKGRRKPRGPLE